MLSLTLLIHTVILTKAFNELELEYHSLQKSHRDLSLSNKDLSIKYENMLQENSHLRQELKQSNDSVIQLNEQLDGLQKELDESQAQAKILRQKVQKYQQVNTTAKVSSTSTKKTQTPVPSRGTSARKWMNFHATYYDANEQSTGKSPGDKDYGITASGRYVAEGVTIAVDPNVIPLGTWVLIKFPDGHLEKRRADDTGSAIQGSDIDIYIPKASLSSGSYTVQVSILD